MADVLKIISIVCFVLSVLFLTVGIVLFFLWNVRGVSAELHGKNLPSVLHKKQRKKKALQKNVAKTNERTERNTAISDEAVTVLDNGEVSGDSLVSFYEPGTELEEDSATKAKDEEDTEINAEPTTMLEFQPWQEWKERTDPAEKETQKNLENEKQKNNLAKNGFCLERDILLTDTKNALDRLF